MTKITMKSCKDVIFAAYEVRTRQYDELAAAYRDIKSRCEGIENLNRELEHKLRVQIKRGNAHAATSPRNQAVAYCVAHGTKSVRAEDLAAWVAAQQ